MRFGEVSSLGRWEGIEIIERAECLRCSKLLNLEVRNPNNGAVPTRSSVRHVKLCKKRKSHKIR